MYGGHIRYGYDSPVRSQMEIEADHSEKDGNRRNYAARRICRFTCTYLGNECEAIE
jgi:hypothetical protein